MTTVNATASESVTTADDITSNPRYALTLADGMTLAELYKTVPGGYIPERLLITSTVQPVARYGLTLADTLSLHDLQRVGFPVSASETLTLTSLAAIVAVAQVLEQLQITSTPLANALYGWLVNERLRLSDNLANFFGIDVTESLNISELLAALSLRGAAITETVDVTVDTAPVMLVKATVAENVDVTAEMALNAIFSAQVLEGIELDLAFVGPDGSITTWAMNTLTGAVTEYQNFDFTSFAEFGGRYYGASADGLFELLGDDDNGQDIVARIKGGFLQFGGTHLSRLKEAYIAVRGGGQVYLRIITGEDETYVYRVDAQSMRNTKFNMGKGQRARYFAYELETVGQDFDLDTLEFVPIAVQRRV